MKKQEKSVITRSKVIAKSLMVLATVFLALDCNGSLFLYDKLFATKSNLRASLEGKRVWITGASSGIGAEFVRQLSDAGAHVILSSRNGKKLEDVVSNSTIVPGKATIVPFDMTGSTKDIQDAVDSAIKDGGVDILILNAAVFQERPALITSISETRDLMRVNYEGPVQLANELIKRDGWQGKKSGQIVAISSRFGIIPGPLSSSYCATKYALNGYFSSLNIEYPWLQVNFALPGPVATNLYKEAKRQTGKESFYGSWPSQMMSPGRVAELVISGMTGPTVLFHEMWISKPLALFGYYQKQFFPLWANKSNAAFGKFAMSCYEYGFDHCLKFW